MSEFSPHTQRLRKINSEELMWRLSDAVKRVRAEQEVSAEENRLFSRPDSSSITNESLSGRNLFSCLELLFLDGLKSKERGIWDAVKYFCRRDITWKIQRLKHVHTSKGKGRAWIYLALNEKELDGYLHSFQVNLPHMYKYYQKSAMICCCHKVATLQTLISSLDVVVFRLDFDVPYLDFTITGAQQKQMIDCGSAVHLDASLVTEPGRKAVRFMKKILSWETSMQQNSRDAENVTTPVAVDCQLTLRAKEYCPDCFRRIELVCLCMTEADAKKDKELSVESENAKILQSALKVGTKSSSVHCLKQCYDTAEADFEEEDLSTAGKLEGDTPLSDSMNEVICKPTRRRKRLSKISRGISTSTKDLHLARCGNSLNISLSDPLIGFDPMNDLFLQGESSICGLTSNHKSAGHYKPTGIAYDTKGVNETDKDERMQDAKHEFAVPWHGTSSGSNLGTSSVKFSTVVNGSEIKLDTRESQKMEVSKERSLDVDKSSTKLTNDDGLENGNVKTLQVSDLPQQALKTSSDEGASTAAFEQGDATLFNPEVEARPKFIADGDQSFVGYSNPDDVSSPSLTSQHGTENNCLNKALSSLQIRTAERLKTESEIRQFEGIFKNTVVSATKEENQCSGIFWNISPSVLCRENSATPPSAEFSLDDCYRDATVSQHDTKSGTPQKISRSRSNSGSFRATLPRGSVSISACGNTSSTVNFQNAKADIDNTLRLYAMLEILKDESEEIVKLFHVSTGHEEGAKTYLCLLFSDVLLYFLRNGDSSSPYWSEYIVSYDHLNYISVGLNKQTIEFVFDKSKPQLPESCKTPRGSVPGKFKIDTTDGNLTDLILSTVSEVMADFVSRRQSTKTMHPPVFNDHAEHLKILLRHLRFEGQGGNILLYQLVHWEDPEFHAGASAYKISLAGTLKRKSRTFLGSSWKPMYFVVSGGILFEYASKNEGKPEACYELTGNNCVGCKRIWLPRSANAGFEFEITFKDKTKLNLCGCSDIEVKEWIECICMVVSLEQVSAAGIETGSDAMTLNFSDRNALVPCGLIVADRALLLFHEDQQTGFCRTLAKARREDIATICFDKNKLLVCELIVEYQSVRSHCAKVVIFFSERQPLETFLATMNSYSKPPTLIDRSDGSLQSSYFEAPVV